MKVLFLGNSHTYFNDMPELFARFVEKTTGEKPEVVMRAYSGRDWAWHRKEYFSLRFNLMHGGYDYCVIQQAAHPYPPIESTLEMGGEIVELCQKCGVKPVVYMTWAEKRLPENQRKMTDTCEKLAREHHALLAPVGVVWEAVLAKHPDIDLFFHDGEHAGPYGDFLIAAALCKTVTGDVSPAVSGMGFDFLQGMSVDFEKPTVIEDVHQMECGLEKDKTDKILEAVRAQRS